MTMGKLRIALWALVTMALIGGGMLFYAIMKPNDKQLVEGFSIGGPFVMTDQNGKDVTKASYSEKSMAIFFGFTHCRDICPDTLSRLSKVIEKLGPQGDKIQFIFVSVDPERDTPAVLKAYLAAFDERFIGLTGTPDQLAAFAKSYRAFYERVPAENGEYTMNHTTGILLFNSKGSFTGTLDPHEADAVALQQLRELISS
jgi:protein SCO1/2